MSTDPMLRAVTGLTEQISRLADELAASGSAARPARPDPFAAALAAAHRNDLNTLAKLVAALDHDDRVALADAADFLGAFIRTRAL